MTHEQSKEYLLLGLVDELTGGERSAYDGHLTSCDECRAEADRAERLHALLMKSAPVRVDDALLAEARAELRAALRREKQRTSVSDLLTGWLGWLVTPKFGFALGAAAMLAVGAFGGAWYAGRNIPQPDKYLEGGKTAADAPGWQPANPWISGTGGESAKTGETEGRSIRSASNTPGTPPGDNVSLHQDDARITNVKILENDPGSGNVEFTFEAVTPMHIKGSVNDPRVQKVLANALLNADNPGVRLRSVTAIASHAEASDVPADKDIKKALLHALQTDDNPAVRKEALRALSKLRFDDEIKKAFLGSLAKDNNSGIRIALINALDTLYAAGTRLDNDVLEVLKQRMQSDDNNYVRLRAKAACQQVRD